MWPTAKLMISPVKILLPVTCGRILMTHESFSSTWLIPFKVCAVAILVKFEIQDMFPYVMFFQFEHYM